MIYKQLVFVFFKQSIFILYFVQPRQQFNQSKCLLYVSLISCFVLVDVK